MYLIFDVETTGLPDKGNFSDVRIVQFSWQVFEESQFVADEQDHIIKPVGFRISAEATKIHGISHKTAEAKGKDLGTILRLFLDSVNEFKPVLVAHNINYDKNVIKNELRIASMESPFGSYPELCTMLSTVEFCKLPSKNSDKYKWPRLEELYSILFKRSFPNAHNSLSDVKATAACFFELKGRGVI